MEAFKDLRASQFLSKGVKAVFKWISGGTLPLAQKCRITECLILLRKPLLNKID
jgi:hypothetical protein